MQDKVTCHLMSFLLGSLIPWKAGYESDFLTGQWTTVVIVHSIWRYRHDRKTDDCVKRSGLGNLEWLKALWKCPNQSFSFFVLKIYGPQKQVGNSAMNCLATSTGGDPKKLGTTGIVSFFFTTLLKPANCFLTAFQGFPSRILFFLWHDEVGVQRENPICYLLDGLCHPV